MSKILGLVAIVALTLGLTSSARAQMGGPVSLPGHEGHELDHNLVLPLIAVGQHYSTNLVLLNLGDPERMGWASAPNLETTGTIYFFRQNGNRFSVKVSGGEPVSEFRFSIKPSEILSLDVGSGGPDTSGWALIEVNQTRGDDSDSGMMDGQQVERGERLSATVFYSLKEGTQLPRVGMYEVQRFFTSILAAHLGGGINTGVAIVNTGSKDASIDIRLKNRKGETVVKKSLFLPKGNQVTRFIDELFAGALSPQFLGSLEVSTREEGVVTKGLVVSQGILTSVPVSHFGEWTRGMMR